MMMIKLLTNQLLLLLCISSAALMVRADTHGTVVPDVTEVSYQDKDGASLTGFLAKLPENADASSPVPAVIIIPDWDGVNYYEQQRATMIAQEFGWVAMAADIYGSEYVNVELDVDTKRQLSSLYRNENPALFMQRIQAAVEYLTTMETAVDADKIALVGYCFGGSGVLMYSIDETVAPVVAVASFHGGLGPHVFNHHLMTSVPQVRQDDMTAVNRPKTLVLSGGEDDMASDIITLENTLNNATNHWEITRYWGIEHAFTKFDDDRYNEWADERSWDSMKQFFQETFGEITFAPQQPASVNVEAVEYVDETDGKQLQGYLAKPEGEGPAPAVVIIPDWDGVNQYEKERATLLAQEGYVAFAADIYGADLQEGLDFATRREQTTLYRSQNVDLFVSRMQRAVELVQSYDFVDAENTALIGYCFGGTGVVQYAFMGRDDVRLIAAYHGNVQEQFLPPIVKEVVPYTMILSGGEDDAHGNQTTLESYLNQGKAEWEITRYSGVFHGFTSWESDAYNLNADTRSWTAMLTAMESLMASGSEEDVPKQDPMVDGGDETDGDGEGDETDGDGESDETSGAGLSREIGMPKLAFATLNLLAFLCIL